MKNTVKLGAKPHSSSTVEKKMTFAISGRRRPYRSAIMPKISAPTGRIASVPVTDSTMAALGDVKMLRQYVEQKNYDEEIEGVEGPAQKAGRDRVPAIGTLGRSVGRG